MASALALAKQTQLHTMKHISKITLFALLVAFFSMASAYAETPSGSKPKKQKAALSLKMNYFTPSYDFINALSRNLNDGAFGIFSHSTVGLSLRIPVWRSLYIQPEVHYGIATNWEEAAHKNNFFSKMANAFNNRQFSYFDVPLFFGFRWEPVKLFAARAYFGPLMHFSLLNKQFNILGQYSLACGAGLDLLNFLSLDAGYRIGMQKLSFLEETGTYFLTLGLKF